MYAGGNHPIGVGAGRQAILLGMKHTLLALPFLTFLAFPLETSATARHVPSEYPTIASALGVSASGDSVVIACGVYSESNLQLVSGVTVCSENGDPSCVTVDAHSDGAFAGNSLSEQTTIRGITIQNAEEGGGAGLRCITDSVVRVFNCVFSNNRATDGAAAGIAFDCDVSFYDCQFSLNRADLGEHHRGGAIYVNESRARFERCFFDQNSATQGGAIFSFNESWIQIIDCRFEGNRALSGGCIYVEGNSNLFVEDSQFDSNEAFSTKDSGGTGGAVIARTGASLVLTHSSFSGNRAAIGGAIAALAGSRMNLNDCVLVLNEAEAGGALNVTSGLFSIGGALFWNNKATDGSGGAALFVQASGRIESSTIHGNSAVAFGSALFAVGSEAAIDIDSCILTRNTASEVVACQSDARIVPQCCDVFRNEVGDWIGCWELFEGARGNFSSDPLYCDPAEGDFALQANSPCIPGGHVSCGLVGAFPIGCGTVSISTSSWGRIKSLYRR